MPHARVFEGAAAVSLGSGVVDAPRVVKRRFSFTRRRLRARHAYGGAARRSLVLLFRRCSGAAGDGMLGWLGAGQVLGRPSLQNALEEGHGGSRRIRVNEWNHRGRK